MFIPSAPLSRQKDPREARDHRCFLHELRLAMEQMFGNTKWQMENLTLKLRGLVDLRHAWIQSPPGQNPVLTLTLLVSRGVFGDV